MRESIFEKYNNHSNRYALQSKSMIKHKFGERIKIQMGT